MILNVKPSDVHVLVVDDDPDLVETISGLFKAFGFNAEIAMNGIEALEKMERSEFQAVLTDIRMPKMDGVTLLKKIREKNRKTPSVMIISGYGDYSAESLYDFGASGFFAKPFGAASVRDALKRALLHPLQRWNADLNISGTTTISKRFYSFEQMIHSGDVKFGSGGFSMALTSPPPAMGSLVQFSFSFREGELTKLEGVGIVRWVRMFPLAGEAKAIGVEFSYIQPDSREKIAQWLMDEDFVSFIPKY